MKKKLALLAAALCFLIGCAAGDEQAGPEEKVLTVVLWDYDKISYDRRLTEAFEALHPDVRVRAISYPDAYYDQKMEALLAGGREVDVFLTRTIPSLKRLCDYGAAYPLDTLMETYGHDLAGAPELDAMRWDGKLYGVPYRRDQYVLVYNCDLFDQAGIAYPPASVTWEQLHGIARQLQPRLGPDEYAMMILPMDIQWIAAGRERPMDYRAGSEEALRPIMTLLREMQEEGTAPKYGDCIARDIQQQCFELGNYGMYIGGSWYLNYLETDRKAGKFDFRWGVTTAPRWEQGHGGDGTVVLSGMGISRNSGEKGLAWEFIRFAAGAEGARIMAEEQMMPAYMDETIRQVYAQHFSGARLDSEVYQNRPRYQPYSGGEDQLAGQDIVCDVFRKCMIGEITVEEALEEMRRQLPGTSG